MLDLFRIFKAEYNDYILLFKSGSFFIAFDEDAVILNKIFNYKLVSLKNNFKVGFPLSLKDKNIEVLKNKKINYVIIEDRKISSSQKFKFNNYKKYKENFLKIMSIDYRISNITKRLKSISNNEDIEKVLDKLEEVLDG